MEEEKTTDFLWKILRPAIIVGFAFGMVMLFLNPPSFSGLWGLVVILVSAVAIVFLLAWVTTRLLGDEMSESDWRRIVDRSDALAKLPPPVSPPSAFDELVIEALDNLPEEFQRILERVPVTVSRDGWKHHAYGMYVGATLAREAYPDHIVIYEDTLTRDFGHHPDLLRAQVERTLRHEVAHHLGWDESGVRSLGL